MEDTQKQEIRLIPYFPEWVRGGNTPLVVKENEMSAYGFDQGATRDVGDAFYEEMSKTVNNGSCPGCHNGVVKENNMGYIVRRLTPRECERLQGFPDNWTLIDDTIVNGKKVKCSDSARYKALGNSIALPFWFELVNRMKPYLDEKATLGSMFDGIGGFPLVWQETYGKGTPRWASEIEPFPIAVTMKHFPEGEEDE